MQNTLGRAKTRILVGMWPGLTNSWMCDKKNIIFPLRNYFGRGGPRAPLMLGMLFSLIILHTCFIFYVKQNISILFTNLNSKVYLYVRFWKFIEFGIIDTNLLEGKIHIISWNIALNKHLKVNWREKMFSINEKIFNSKSFFYFFTLALNPI